MQASDVAPTLLGASYLSPDSIRRAVTRLCFVKDSGLLEDLFVVSENDRLLRTAQKMYDDFHRPPLNTPQENLNRSWLQNHYASKGPVHNPKEEPYKGLFSYLDQAPNLALIMQDLTWGIITWSTMLKSGFRMPIQIELIRLGVAARSQTNSWSIDSKLRFTDTKRALQSRRRFECGDEYYVGNLVWTICMAIYCAGLIESNQDTWITEQPDGHLLEREVWQSAEQHFLRSSDLITLGTTEGELTTEKVLEGHRYSFENPFVTLSSLEQAEDQLKKTRRDIAFKTLAAASVVTAKIYQVMRKEPHLFEVIAGDHSDA